MLEARLEEGRQLLADYIEATSRHIVVCEALLATLKRDLEIPGPDITLIRITKAEEYPILARELGDIVQRFEDARIPKQSQFLPQLEHTLSRLYDALDDFHATLTQSYKEFSEFNSENKTRGENHADLDIVYDSGALTIALAAVEALMKKVTQLDIDVYVLLGEK